MPVSSRIVATAAAICFAGAALFAQDGGGARQALRTTNAPPKATGTTPRAPDGHPDLTGVWNALGDNLNGVPNQIANNGISIESATVARDLHSGQLVTVFPRLDNRPKNNEQAERAAALLRRSGSNRPIYKPEYWDMVKYNDHNANEEDPSNNCMPAGIPRGGIPSYIAQFPNYVVFIYPGQGGLIATQTMYRMIPTAGRKPTPTAAIPARASAAGKATRSSSIRTGSTRTPGSIRSAATCTVRTCMSSSATSAMAIRSRGR
jgi:hypothetical protein